MFKPILRKKRINFDCNMVKDFSGFFILCLHYIWNLESGLNDNRWQHCLEDKIHC